MLGANRLVADAKSCPVGKQKNEEKRVHDEPGRLDVDALEVEVHGELQGGREDDEDRCEPRGGPPPAMHQVPTEAVCDSYDDYNRQEPHGANEGARPRS